MQSHRSRARIATGRGDDSGPKLPSRAKLGHLGKEIPGYGVGKADLPCRRVDSHPAVRHLAKVVDPGGDGVCELLNSACSAPIVGRAGHPGRSKVRRVVVTPGCEIAQLGEARGEPSLDPPLSHQLTDRIERETTTKGAEVDPSSFGDSK